MPPPPPGNVGGLGPGEGIGIGGARHRPARTGVPPVTLAAVPQDDPEMMAAIEAKRKEMASQKDKEKEAALEKQRQQVCRGGPRSRGRRRGVLSGGNVAGRRFLAGTNRFGGGGGGQGFA